MRYTVYARIITVSTITLVVLPPVQLIRAPHPRSESCRKMPATAPAASSGVKLLLGGLLLCFNAGSTVLNQMALAEHAGRMVWSPAISASATEALKLVVAAAFLCRQVVCGGGGGGGGSGGSGGGDGGIQKNAGVSMPMGACFVVRYAVPGLLYAGCNVLMYTAVELVGSTNFQLLNNMKIITTAIIYRLALRRRLRVHQWMALLMLFIAMCTLGLTQHQSDRASSQSPANNLTSSSSSSSSSARHRNGTFATSAEDEFSASQLFAGFLLMLFLSCLSAAAGVYNEVLIKGTDASVWWQNVLLYAFTLSFCLVGNLFDASAGGLARARPTAAAATTLGAADPGLFAGFSTTLWAVILIKAFYGQVVSLVFKYASNILKVYSTSLSVIASAVLCFFLLGTPLAPVHFVGGALIILATILFYAGAETLVMDDVECVGCGKDGTRSKDAFGSGSAGKRSV